MIIVRSIMIIEYYDHSQEYYDHSQEYYDHRVL